MPITNSIDLKSLLKLEKYAGEKEKFKDFKWQLYVAVRVLHDGLLTRLEWVEKHLEEDYAMSRLDPADQALSTEAYTLLALLCTDQALEYVKAAEENNGFEAWKQLCKGRMLRSSVALLDQLLDPKCSSTDPRVNIRNWQGEVRDYQSRTGDTINDVTKKSIYMNKLAPEVMRQHLRLNQGRLMTADDVVQEIEEYVEACEDGEQMMTGSVNAVGKGSETHVKKSQFDKKGKGKDNKSKDKGKGKSKGKEGKSEKGKLHKGLGKEAPRGEQRKFGGQCNWCWRIGHKEAQCWFKQAYDKENGKGAKAPDADATQSTLDHWRRRPEDASSSSAMNVSAVQPVTAVTHYTRDNPFCFAITSQALAEIEEETWQIENEYEQQWEAPPWEEAPWDYDEAWHSPPYQVPAYQSYDVPIPDEDDDDLKEQEWEAPPCEEVVGPKPPRQDASRQRQRCQHLLRGLRSIDEDG